MPTYHFHAICQSALGSVSNMDGLIVRSEPILTGDDYTRVKNDLAKEFGHDPSKLVICSLSVLTPNNLIGIDTV